MSVISIPIVVIASVSFYAGLYHLLIYIRRRQHREDLIFAMMCFANGFYDVFCAGLYNATSVADGVQWQRMQFITIAFFNIAFLWFASVYTHQKPQKLTYALSVFFLFAAIVQVVDRSDLTWLVNRPAIKDMILPFGTRVTYYEATLGLFTTVQGIMGLIPGIYILVNTLRFYKRGYKREATPLIITLVFLYAAAINDTAVSNGVYEFIYMIEYGYIALILLMAYSLSNIIVEATKTKTSLIESEERYRTIVENSHSGILTVDDDYKFKYANDQLCNILGYSRQELIGMDFRLVLDDESKQKVANYYIRRHRGESVSPRYEMCVNRKDGEKRILEMSAAATKLSSGAMSTIGQVLDITERKRLEHENEERRLYLESIFASVPDAIVTSDIQHHISEWNPGAERLFGYTAEEVVGKNINELIAGGNDIINREAANWTQHIQKGESIPLTETTRYRKDGSTVYVIASVSPILIGGEWNGVVAVYTDITERKRAEAALRESEEKYHSLFETSPESVTLLDLDGIIRDCNEMTLQMGGVSRDQYIGKTFMDLGVLSEKDLPKYVERFYNALRGETLAPMQIETVLPDHQTRWVEIFPALLKKDNQVYAIQIITRDIDERKRAEAERENLIKELETRNAELERFAYIVSHDLRSPLVTIRGFLGYLEKNVSLGHIDQVKEDLGRIATATNKMQRMLNELLELSRIGRMMNPSEEIDFSLLIKDAVDLVRMSIEARGIQINIAENLPSVFGDRARLLEVVQNLMDNACKFMGDQPSPLIEIGTSGADPNGAPVFFIRDNGIGVDPQFHERIFGIFNKLDVHTDGTGVGLALVKRIVEEHGGRIWVESQGKGTGSTFYFTLPASPDSSI
jgi:PAS domain S-box-containing protein